MTGLKADSIALTEHIRSVSKKRLVRYIGSIEVATMTQVADALKIALELD